METARTKDFTEENLYSRTQRFEALAWDRLIKEDADEHRDKFHAEWWFDDYFRKEARKWGNSDPKWSHLTTPEKVCCTPTTGSLWAFRALAAHYKIERWLPKMTQEERKTFELLYVTKKKVFNLDEVHMKDGLFFMPLGGAWQEQQQAALISLLNSLEDKRLKAEGASVDLPESDDDDDALFERAKRRGQGQAEFDYPF
jgi:hypothetical protein